MLIFLIIYGVVSFMGMIFIAYFMLISPEGWEDENGFHYKKGE